MELPNIQEVIFDNLTKTEEPSKTIIGNILAEVKRTMIHNNKPELQETKRLVIDTM